MAHPAQNLLCDYGQPQGLSEWLEHVLFSEGVGPGCFQNLLVIKKKKKSLANLGWNIQLPQLLPQGFWRWWSGLGPKLESVIETSPSGDPWHQGGLGNIGINTASLHTPVPQPTHGCVGWGGGGEVCPWLMKLLTGHYISKRLQILGCQLSRISHHRITLMPGQPVLQKRPVGLCSLTHGWFLPGTSALSQKSAEPRPAAGVSCQPLQASFLRVSRKLTIFAAPLSTEGRIWGRQPTPLFLPEKSQGQRSLVGYSPWGCKRVIQNLVTK